MDGRQKELLPFELIEEFREALKSYGGLPFVVVTCEALGLGAFGQAACSSKAAPSRLYRLEDKRHGEQGFKFFVISCSTFITQDFVK